MPLVIKLMSDEDAPDQETRKSYRLLTGVIAVEFSRDRDGSATAEILFNDSDDAETIDLVGNVYVMNEAGKTISSFGYAPLLFAKGGAD